MRWNWAYSRHWWAVHLHWWWSDTKLLARRSVQEFIDDRCSQLAAGISYYALLSIFPFVILFVSISGLILQDNSLREDLITELTDVLPVSEGEGREDVESLVDGVASGLSALGFLSIFALMWSASGMMGAIRRALNEAWDTDFRRPFLRAKLIDLAMIGGLGVLVTLSIGTTIFLQVARRASDSLSDGLGPAGAGATVGFEVVAIVVPLAFSFSVFLILYKVVPAVRTRFRHVWPGALVAALGFELIKNAFAIYLANFGNYDAVYGSLGAVIAFLFFVYLSANIMLFGAEFASEWPRVIHGHYDTSLDRPTRRSTRKQIGAALKGLVHTQTSMPEHVDAEAGAARKQRKAEHVEEEVARRRTAQETAPPLPDPAAPPAAPAPPDPAPADPAPDPPPADPAPDSD